MDKKNKKKMSASSADMICGRSVVVSGASGKLGLTMVRPSLQSVPRAASAA